MKIIQSFMISVRFLLLILVIPIVMGAENTNILSRVSEPNQDSPAIIKIKGLMFEPESITIALGTRVRWINSDPIDHDVTSGVSIVGREARGLTKTKFPNELFSSGLFGSGKYYEYTFQKPGEYSYYCNIHPFMTGVIKVNE